MWLFGKPVSWADAAIDRLRQGTHEQVVTTAWSVRAARHASELQRRQKSSVCAMVCRFGKVRQPKVLHTEEVDGILYGAISYTAGTTDIEHH